MPALVLDPSGQRWENAAFVTTDTDQFIDIAFQNERCLLVVDESGEALDKTNPAHMSLATRSRHRGHTAFFIAQRATQIPPLVRQQCVQAYIFKQSRREIQILIDCLACDGIAEVAKLKKGQCLKANPYDIPVIIDVFK